MQHLFFNPVKSDFQGISLNGRIVSSKDRKLISNDNANPSVFLGIKKCIEDTSNSTNDIFIVTHQQAYSLTKSLYEAISNVQVSWDYYSDTPNMDWALFLVSSFTSIDKIDTSENTLIADFLTFEQQRHPILKNFDLIVGVQNGYDNEDEITFYAVIKHRQYDRGCYLTIGSYKFSHPTKLDFIANQYDVKVLIKDLQNRAAIELKKEIKAFKKLYTNLYEVKWANILNDFIPVSLDIFNFNRSIESIKNDKNLKNDINSTIDNSKYFLFLSINEGRYDFAMLLDYVIFSNHFDIIAFQNNRKKTEQVFIQKRAYKTIKQRITNVVQTDTRIADYIKEQNDIYRKILPYLTLMPILFYNL